MGLLLFGITKHVYVRTCKCTHLCDSYFTHCNTWQGNHISFAEVHVVLNLLPKGGSSLPRCLTMFISIN